ncbi:leucine-rich repeat-containing protein 72 isoform X2 [Ranitomeya variabilis]
MSRFRLLKYLWLNHNKISKVNFLGSNFRLTELYLNSNELCDITGSLKHLSSLQTLMLHDNHLTDLKGTVKELRGMTDLRVLNLFHNPLGQDPCYRRTVIHHLPPVQLLDREYVTQKEREEAFQLFNPQRTAVIQSLGFGRRTDSVIGSRAAAGRGSTGRRSYSECPHGRHQGHSPSATRGPSTPGTSGSMEERSVAHNAPLGAKVLFVPNSNLAPTLSTLYRRKGNRVLTSNTKSNDGFTLDDKVLLRGYHRSIMQFTLFDWNKIPVSKLLRSEENPKDAPQLITVTFR